MNACHYLKIVTFRTKMRSMSELKDEEEMDMKVRVSDLSQESLNDKQINKLIN